MYITFHTPYPQPEYPPCPACGMMLSNIAHTGKLGCDRCYVHFEERLSSYIRRIHGPGSHNGTIPQSAGSELANRRKLSQLRKFLNEAIETQEFETCAKLRDEIIALEENSNTQEGDVL